MTRKPLRVTAPEGLQRSTYSVSVPLKFGLPVLIAFSVLHWTISQSVFVVYITRIFSNGEEDVLSRTSSSGSSCIAIMTCEHYSSLCHQIPPLKYFSARTRLSASCGVARHWCMLSIQVWNTISFNMQCSHQRFLSSSVS